MTTRSLFLILLSWRFLLFILGFLVAAKFSIAPGYPIPTGRIYTHLRFIDAWANWDGGHYLSIADRGYDISQVAAFPAYPILVKLSGFLFLGKLAVAGLVVNFLLTLGAFYFLIKLFEIDFLGLKINSLILLLSGLVLPVAFLFAAAYSEAVFFFLAAFLFYCLRTHQFVWLIPAGFLIGMSRPVGFILLPVLLFEVWFQKEYQLAEKRKASLYLLSVPLGLLAYLVFLTLQFHDPLVFFKGTIAWRMGWHYPTVIQAIAWAVRQAHYPGSYFLNLVELGLFFLYAAMTPLTFKFLRSSYGALQVFLIGLPLLSNTLYSFPRLLLVSFPAIFLFTLLYRKKKWVWGIFFVAFLILQIWLLKRFLLGFWVA